VAGGIVTVLTHPRTIPSRILYASGATVATIHGEAPVSGPSPSIAAVAKHERTGKERTMFSQIRSSRVSVTVRLLVVAAVLLMAVTSVGRATAQDTSRMPMYGGATVTVLGHGSVTMKPDVASLSVGVSVTKPELAAAQSEAATVMTRVLAAIRAAGVLDDDIQTSYYNVYAITKYDETGNPDGVSGYQVSNQVQVMIRDLDAVNSLLEDVVTAGANMIYGVTFGVADPTAAKSEARAEAVADAKTRAEELAAAAGMTLGQIVSMSEGVVGGQVYYGDQGAGGRGGGPIESGSLEVTVDVEVTYELV
jgi:uncharacterized protein YggE